MAKECTWDGCKNEAKHQKQGSLIALCDKHEKILNDDIEKLVKEKENIKK